MAIKKKNIVTKEISEFYKNNDGRFDHFLIRCARSTSLFEYLSSYKTHINEYDLDKLLIKPTDEYKNNIAGLNKILKILYAKSEKEQKTDFKKLLLERKLELKMLKRSKAKKELIAAKKQQVKDFKKLGYKGLHESRLSQTRKLLMQNGDLLIEQDERMEKYNPRVEEFFAGLPKTVIKPLRKDDTQPIKSPDAIEKLLNVKMSNCKTEEIYYKRALNALRGLTERQREKFEVQALKCAEKRAQEEQEKNESFRLRMAQLKKEIFMWKDSSKFAEVRDVAIRSVNNASWYTPVTEMLSYSRMKTMSITTGIYRGLVHELQKKLHDINEEQM